MNGSHLDDMNKMCVKVCRLDGVVVVMFKKPKPNWSSIFILIHFFFLLFVIVA